MKAGEQAVRLRQQWGSAVVVVPDREVRSGWEKRETGSGYFSVPYFAIFRATLWNKPGAVAQQRLNFIPKAP
jgi:hypothetical protein